MPFCGGGKLFDCRLKSGRIIRLFVRPDPFLRTFVQYLVAFYNRPEGASDSTLVNQIVLEKCGKFGHHRLNRSGEIAPEAVGSGNFDSFFCYNFLPKV